MSNETANLNFAFCSISLNAPVEVYWNEIIQIKGRISSFLIPKEGANVKISVDGTEVASTQSGINGDFSVTVRAEQFGTGSHTIMAEAWAVGFVACNIATREIKILREGEIPWRTIMQYVAIGGGVLLLGGIAYIGYKSIKR